MVVKTSVVEAKGIGKKDYTQGIEFSVEPTIRSYQEVYSNWQAVAVVAGATVQTDITIPGGHVAIAYDFYATFPTLTLLRMVVEAVDAGVIVGIIRESKHGSITKHLTKGFPFLDIVRFTLENLSSVDLVVNIGVVGIYTDEEHYYLTTALPYIP